MDEAFVGTTRAPLRPAALVLALAVATIAGAFAFQAAGYAPCELCLEERLPYYAGIALAAVTLALARFASPALARVGLALLALLFLFSARLRRLSRRRRMEVVGGSNRLHRRHQPPDVERRLPAAAAKRARRALRRRGDPHPWPLARRLERDRVAYHRRRGGGRGETLAFHSGRGGAPSVGPVTPSPRTRRHAG